MGHNQVMLAAMRRHEDKQSLKDERKQRELDDHHDNMARDQKQLEVESDTRKRHKAMIFDELTK